MVNERFRFLCKGYKQLELSTTNSDVAEHWKWAFLRAGVAVEKRMPAMSVDEGVDAAAIEGAALVSDPALERQIETLRSLVDSYMRIVTKTLKDIVPKAIMHLIVNHLCGFIREDLLAQLYQVEDLVCPPFFL